MYGNTETINSLQSLLRDENKIPHSYLFGGPPGCGKTTLGRIIAKKLGCRDFDFKELNSADFRGIDMIRELVQQVKYAPMESPCKVWLMDECHKLTNDAQNALLKLLEEPPSYVYFILCTSEPEKLIKAVKERCVQYMVKPLDVKDARQLLIDTLEKEKKEVPEEEVLEKIINVSGGVPRNILQLLNKVLSVPEKEQIKIIEDADINEKEAIDLCRALMKGASWKEIAGLIKDLKPGTGSMDKAETIRRVVLGYAQAILLNGQQNDQAAFLIECFSEPFWNSGFPALTLACYTFKFGVNS